MQSPLMTPRGGSSGFNAFARPVDGINSKSTSGGIITILAYTTATILFLSQIYLYIKVDIRHSLDLAPSFPLSEVIPTDGGFSKKILQARGHKKNKHSAGGRNKSVIDAMRFIEKNKIDVFVHVTFPYMRCEDLDFAHNSAFFSTGDFSKNHGYAQFTKRAPTEYDWAVAMGETDLKGKNKRKAAKNKEASNACTVRGTISVPRISGDITIFMSKEAFMKIVQMLQMGMNLDQIDKQRGTGHDLSHYIHDITFGTNFPLSPNPLSNKMVKIINEERVALNHMNVKLVPTKYKKFARKAKETFQISVSNHIVTMETLSKSVPFTLPGMKIQYDFTPLAVHHVESRENFFVFLSSLIGIVGGVFVTVGLVSGFVVNSAQALKKND